MTSLVELLILFSPCLILAAAAGYGLGHYSKKECGSDVFFAFSENGELKEGGSRIQNVLLKKGPVHDFEVFYDTLKANRLDQNELAHGFIRQALRKNCDERLVFTEIVSGANDTIQLCRIFDSGNNLTGDFVDITFFYNHLRALFLKLEQIGTLSHDMSNLLSIISGYSYAAYASMKKGEGARESLDKIHVTIEKGNEILERFSHLGKGLWRDNLPDTGNARLSQKDNEKKAPDKALIINLNDKDEYKYYTNLIPWLRSQNFEIYRTKDKNQALASIEAQSPHFEAVFICRQKKDPQAEKLHKLISEICPNVSVIHISTQDIGDQRYLALNIERMNHSSFIKALRANGICSPVHYSKTTAVITGRQNHAKHFAKKGGRIS